MAVTKSDENNFRFLQKTQQMHIDARNSKLLLLKNIIVC